MSSLFPYQIQGVDFLSRHHAALLADAPRLGKTCQTLMAAHAVGPRTPILVAGPAISRPVWQVEASQWRPDLSVRRVEHRGEFRFPRPGELVTTSYELTPTSFRDEEIEPGTILVGDEIQRVSYQDAARTKRFEQLCFAVRRRGGRVWLLSATPLENTPLQIWTVTGLLSSQQLVWGDYAGFLAAFEGKPFPYGHGRIAWGLPDATLPDRLSRVMMRRTRPEVSTQLPRNSVQVIPVPLSASAERLCDNALRAIKRRGMSLAEACTLASMRTPPTWLSGISKSKAAVAISKLPYAMQMIENYESHGEPLVVMTASRAVSDAIGCRDNWACLTGDTSARRREDVQSDFRAGRLKGVACTIASSGTAIDLSTASAILFVDISWDPASVSQAAERIEGPRQTRPTTTMFLKARHPIEEMLWNANAEKAAVIRLAMERVA